MLNGPSPSPESTTFPRDGNIGPHLAKIPAAILIRTLPPTPKKKTLSWSRLKDVLSKWEFGSNPRPLFQSNQRRPRLISATDAEIRPPIDNSNDESWGSDAAGERKRKKTAHLFRIAFFSAGKKIWSLLGAIAIESKLYFFLVFDAVFVVSLVGNCSSVQGPSVCSGTIVLAPKHLSYDTFLKKYLSLF